MSSSEQHKDDVGRIVFLVWIVKDKENHGNLDSPQ